MTRSMFLLGAGILAAAEVFGLAGALPLPAALAQPAGPLPMLTQICTPGDADSFVKSIYVLDANYKPHKNGNGYDKPGKHASHFQPNTNNAITTDLKNAFKIAPLFFQQHLCSLNGIYISPSACSNRDAYNCTPPAGPTGFDGSWGFRSRATTDLGALNIAIPAVLWPNGGHALSFDLYESLVLGNPAFYGGGIASVGTPTPNTPETTVLAALAHELGHVRWAMATVQPYVGGSYYFGTLQSCVISNTTTDFFYGWDYQSNTQLAAPSRWRDFADQHNSSSGGVPVDHLSPPTFGDLTGVNPNKAIYDLYQADQPWASLFGAQTPDEDFVETYVMYALTGFAPDPANPANDKFNGPLTSLPLIIPNYTGPSYPNQWADVPRDLRAGNKLTLQAKMRCIPV